MRPRSLVLLLTLAFTSRSALGQQRVVVQGLIEAEGWRTRGGSVLLARNQDRPGLAGRLHLWSAADLRHGLTLLALGELSGGAASVEGDTEVELEQLVLQWRPRRTVGLDLGRFPAPIGTFAARRLASANPVIGAPDSYQVSYPWGVQLSGLVGRLDYRLAAMNRPITNPKYLPSGGAKMRLAGGVGFTAAPGIRIGASYTAGPYLSDSIAPLLSGGLRWDDFGQRLLVIDGLFTRGYFELRTETSFSSYDVPTHANATSGVSSFVEARYTWTPRVFTAVRLEYNGYAFVRPIAADNWLARRTTFYDGEAGVGLRLGPSTLVKVTYRRDDWRVEPPLDQFLKNGSALAFQVSRGFDVTSWFSGPR